MASSERARGRPGNGWSPRLQWLVGLVPTLRLGLRYEDSAWHAVLVAHPNTEHPRLAGSGRGGTPAQAIAGALTDAELHIDYPPVVLRVDYAPEVGNGR